MTNLTNAESHFAFGENWKSFLSVVDQRRIEESDAGIRKLFPEGELSGAYVLDIGCGSGLPALSLARAGALRVDCVDIDANSVEATRSLLSSELPAERWSARVESVFGPPEQQYDVVHSWGVLHHTGDMWRAIDKAASLVKPGGLLAIAIYRKTTLCSFWKIEKRFYASAPVALQRPVRLMFKALLLIGIWLRRGKRPSQYIGDYHRNRGMDWDHDLHDWLGGYPYESASVTELEEFVRTRGFTMERNFTRPPGLGLSGSGCDEYVFRLG